MFHKNNQLNINLNPAAVKSRAANPQLYERIDAIMPYAENKDVAGLHAAFPAFNISYKSVTVIEELARTGHHGLVKWLIGKKVQGNKNAAAIGYAAGGYDSQLDKLIEAGVHIKFKLMGLAKAGEIKKIDSILRKSDNPAFLTRFALMGYAQAGNVTQVELLIRNGCNPNHAIAGYAAAGQHSLVNNLIMRGFSLDHAVLPYAANGYKEQVNELIQRGAAVSQAVSGYAIGGHQQHAEDLMKSVKDGSLDINVLAGYAYASHRPAQNVMLGSPIMPEQIETLKLQYAFAGNFTGVEELLKMDSNADKIVLGYASGGYAEAECIKSSHAANIRFRTYAATANIKLLSLFLNETANRLPALRIMSSCRHINEINLLQVNTPEEINAVANGFAESNILSGNDEGIRYLFAAIENDALRAATYESFKAKIESINDKELETRDIDCLAAIYDSALVIHRIMKDLNLDYRLASALRLTCVKDWIFYGIPAVTQGAPWLKKSKDLSLDCYFEVLSLLTQLPREDIIIIYAALCLDWKSKISSSHSCDVDTLKNIKSKHEQTFLQYVGFFLRRPESTLENVTDAALAAAPMQHSDVSKASL